MSNPEERAARQVRSPRVRLRRALAVMVCAVAVSIATFGVTPNPAAAFEVAKLTAKPNADSGSDILGATETRITWEGAAAPDESLSGFSLTLPDNTSYTLDDARVTQLDGADRMTRVNIKSKISQDGQTVQVEFAEPARAGAYFRLEVYGVKFPGDGGTMDFTGAYTLADGSEHQMGEIPSVTVKGVSATDQLSHYLEEQPWVQAWNSNKFLRLFFNPPILVSSFPVVFSGFLMAVAIVAVAYPCAIPFGFVLALMRISKSRIIRAIASVYVNIVRGTPMFLQIYIAFFGLPLAGIKIPAFPLGVLVLAMNSGAYLAEIFRAGIQSIDKGQNEAARSLGMTGVQTMVSIIIPQTFRRVIPNLTSEFILLYKDTSLLAAVGVMEVVMYAKTIVANTGSITPYIVAAVFYLIVTLPMARVVSLLEARLADGTAGKRRRPRRGAKAATTTDSATDRA